MKMMREQFNKMRPLFEKGGKFEKLYPLFEAKETFLFVLAQRTSKGSHIRDALDTKRFMSMVIVALVPTLLFGMFNVGYQMYATQGQEVLAATSPIAMFLLGMRYVLPIVIVSYAAGGVWEVLFAVVRKHEINEGFLVTGLLVPLIVPPTIPLWQVAVGVSFGVVIGKEVFGGTGMNIFNPALVARAFLFFAYPAQISGDKVWALNPGNVHDIWKTNPDLPMQVVDGYSGATPLLVASDVSGSVESAQSVTEALNVFGQQAGFADFSWLKSFIGLIPGSIGETSALACLLGAILLIVTGVGSWRIMVACVVGAVVMSTSLNLVAPSPTHFLALPPWYHLVVGGFAFGVTYMATDPVSGSQTNVGKYIYGFFIGVLTILIRTVNPAFPEGIMLAILFMNAFAPLIDYYVVEANMKRRLRRAQV